MEPLYSIVFMGEMVPGRSAQQIIEAFAVRFRVSEEKARQVVLGGTRTVLKRGLDPVKAQRYSVALRKVGLLVALEPVSQAPVAGHSEEVSHSIDVGQTEYYYADPGAFGAPEAVSLGSPFTAPFVAPAEVPTPVAVPPPTPSVTAGGSADAARCPKCRAEAVSPLTGVCQACGLVVERYAASRVDPASEPGDAAATAASGRRGDRLHRPRSVSAGRGGAWVSQAWGLFAFHPWAWVGATLLYLLIAIAVSLIPGVGGLAMLILGPIFTGGLMIGAHSQYRGGRFKFKHLFAGFRRAPGPLALIGVTSLGLTLLCLLPLVLLGLVAASPVVGTDAIAGVGQDLLDPVHRAQLVQGVLARPLDSLNLIVILVALSVALLVGTLFAMAVFFAPAMVALNAVPVLRAFTCSIQGCWRNLLPLLIFGLVALALSVLSVLTLGLGLLVLTPVLIIATYMGFRDIYYR